MSLVFSIASLSAGLILCFLIGHTAQDFDVRPSGSGANVGISGKQTDLCRKPAFLNKDGCIGAPDFVNVTLSFQRRSLFEDGSFFQQSQETVGVSRINWNVAGKDFAVGVRPGIYCGGKSLPCSSTPGATNLIDATLYDWSRDPAHFGCASGSSYNALSREIVCLAKAGMLRINGVDFSPMVGGAATCTTLYVAPYPGAAVRSAVLENFRWKMEEDYGVAGHGCPDPKHGFALRFNFGPDQQTDITVTNGIIDSQGNKPYNQTSGTHPRGTNSSLPTAVDANSGGSVTYQYLYCSNVIARCVAAKICKSFNTSYNVVNSGGHYPGYLHYEFALYYAQPNCVPSQTILNNTEWQDAITDSPAATAPISTGEPPGDPLKFSFLDLELNTIGTNRIGGASPYWALGETVPVVGGSQSGRYRVGDVLAITGAGCIKSPQVVVVSVTDDVVTKVAPFLGGVCLSRPSSSIFYETKCVSGACVVSKGAGVAIKSIYSNWTVGYGIQIGQVEYLGDVVIANNAVDPSGTADPQKFGIVYQSTICASRSIFSENYSLLTGINIKAYGKNEGCAVGP